MTITEPRIIGERINPTGKKLFKEALLRGDMDYILNQALGQIGAGADILDVNVGLPGIDEKEMMISAVKSIQAIVDVPLQVDSTIPEVLDAALRVYNGKPIVNSVNGEEKSLKAVLPLVKKYGAAVVGLTLDENGIPPKAEDRFKIAQRILERAQAIGIPKENVYIDCLTLTASAEQEGVTETLNAVYRVKHELGLKPYWVYQTFPSTAKQSVSQPYFLNHGTAKWIRPSDYQSEYSRNDGCGQSLQTACQY